MTEPQPRRRGNGKEPHGAPKGKAKAKGANGFQRPPQAQEPTFLTLPESARSLTNHPNWVVWRFETTAAGKPTKVPYQPRHSSMPARTNDKSTWTLYGEACAAYRAGGFDGIGFVLTGTPFAAFDLDGCMTRDDSGGASIVPQAQALLESCGSYAEVTPSGRGLRVIGYAHGDHVHSKQSQGEYSLEIYRKAVRFVTVTGDVLPGFDRQFANIDPTIDRLRPPPMTKAEARKQGNGVDADATYDYPPRAFAKGDDGEGVVDAKTMTTIRDGVPVGQRSEVFQSVVNRLYRLGFAAEDVLTLFEKYPDGIAEKCGRRLKTEVDRSWSKAVIFEAARIDGLLAQHFEKLPKGGPDELLASWLYASRANGAGGASSDDSGAKPTGDAKIISAPMFSDEALALEFADKHRRDFRYVAAWGQWMCWTGTHWRKDETLRAREAARIVCRDAARECNKASEAKKIAGAKTVAAVEALAKADHRLAATIDQWDADLFLLNTPGGVIDLRTGECRPARPDDYLTKMTAVAPSNAGCPLFLDFLSTVCAGDAELIAYLRRVFGYGLTGDVSEHALFFDYGTGANGKSVLLSTVSGIFFNYHKTASIETFTASNSDHHPTDVANLRGARLVTATETEEGRRWAESRIKQLTGGDPVSARFMRQDFFEFIPQFKLMVAGNHKPSLRSVNEAIRRRMNMIPFAVTIPPEKRDKALASNISVNVTSETT